MSQINLHTTPAFEKALARLMRVRRIATKSEAIRLAVEEAAAREMRRAPGGLRALIGAATRAPLNPRPQFDSDDELWETGRGR
jgi:hypothetical protein